MTRTEANQIALKVMRDNLEVAWYSSATTNRLTMRGVQIKKDLAQALMDAYDEGDREGYRTAAMEQ